MRDREKRCSECLQLQDKEMESPYVCEECEGKLVSIYKSPEGLLDFKMRLQNETRG